MDKETKFKTIPNNRKNAAELSYGDGYWVEYFDWRAGEVRAALGIAITGVRFHFPAMRLREVPTIKCREGGNYITGWYRVKDWRP